jgi:hypothetical protein
MQQPESQGDWVEYRRLILQELQRLADGISDVKIQLATLHSMDIAAIKAEIAVLRFKSGLWGAVAGAIPSVAALIYVTLKP